MCAYLILYSVLLEYVSRLEHCELLEVYGQGYSEKRTDERTEKRGRKKEGQDRRAE